MSKRDDCIAELRIREEWEPWLMANSGLPGPRGNLELLSAVAEMGTESQFLRWLDLPETEAPVNSPAEFLVACGAAGLGRLLAEHPERGEIWERLRRAAEDPRWRTREGVAMALQRVGDADMSLLIEEMRIWEHGSHYVQRAVVAGLCEPRLLKNTKSVRAVLAILDEITLGVEEWPRTARDEPRRVLSLALEYGWSVAAVADLSAGKVLIEKWCASASPLVRRIMRENLKKNRLIRLDPEWCSTLVARLA